MQWLFVFLRGHRAYVALGVAVLVSFSLMALGRSDGVALARGIAAGLMKAGHGLFTWPMELSRLRHENRVLRDQNLRISLELLELREARMENLRLRALLDFRTKAEGTYLVARVVARDPNRVLNTVLLDIGASDGLEKRMPVVTADGLVGRVLEVHPHTAVVQLLLDRNCRVSAIVQRDERTSGIVTCENGSFFLRHVSVRSEVSEGDRVISSGLGGVFPKGLLIGMVSRVGERDQALFREVQLTPSVDFFNLEEVFVLKSADVKDAGPG
ncbi:MAG: rod shape-determining protein MreC [Gemmatimonadota bacterium]|nr:rod shape-determining protein MreC [Gemmatimonadota bacterium]